MGYSASRAADTIPKRVTHDGVAISVAPAKVLALDES